MRDSKPQGGYPQPQVQLPKYLLVALADISEEFASKALPLEALTVR